jgi:hypothetical protein
MIIGRDDRVGPAGQADARAKVLLLRPERRTVPMARRAA